MVARKMAVSILAQVVHLEADRKVQKEIEQRADPTRTKKVQKLVTKED